MRSDPPPTYLLGLENGVSIVLKCVCRKYDGYVLQIVMLSNWIAEEQSARGNKKRDREANKYANTQMQIQKNDVRGGNDDRRIINIW